MKKDKRKIIIILLIIIILTGVNVYAHSGRTDSSGGHKDNKNKSGLGSYHYHCGGNPAHLHNNGACPYSSSSTPRPSSSSNKSSSSSSSSTATTKPVIVAAIGIQINENTQSIQLGKSATLTATITPSNTTDKNIIWKSSDESIATVSPIGEIFAKKSGIVDITATTSNDKTSTVKISIKEEPKVENTAIIKTSASSKNYIANNTTTNNKEDSNPLGIILALGLIGGGSYLGYKKYKKS